MREISTKSIEIGEHVLIDGVEYVVEEDVDTCESCDMAGCGFCYMIPCKNGLNLKRVKVPTHEVEKKIIQTYGIHAQSLIACEELAELIQAISKTIRGGHGTDNLIEEIADSEIMIEQLEIFYGIDRKKIDEVKRYKLERQLKRIEDAKKRSSEIFDNIIRKNCLDCHWYQQRGVKFECTHELGECKGERFEQEEP